MVIIDLSGERFGKLLVIKRAGTDKNRKALWECRCDCGKVVKINANNLRKGTSRTCGCSRGESHGLSKDRLYSIWRHMKSRCLNPKDKNYNIYGQRGIDVCAEWFSFVNFKNWSIENAYDKNLTLDRIDNNRGYSPENCRWVGQKVQHRNKRSNRIINGKCISEWAEEYHIPLSTLRSRLNKGLPIEKAVIHE